MVTFQTSPALGYATRANKYEDSNERPQIEAEATFLIISKIHVDILYIIKMKIALFRSIAMCYGIDNILRNIPHIQPE